MTIKEGERLQAFIAKQEKDWEKHCADIGLIGRVIEKIFGSQFAHTQLLEFRHFCNNGYKTKINYGKQTENYTESIL